MKNLVLSSVLITATLIHADLIDVGDRAPDFSLRLPNGAQTNLGTLVKEGPVLLRFAATG
jgi:hypothetical protein